MGETLLDAPPGVPVETASSDELLLIDLSSIAHPIWHMSQSEPDPNATATKTVDRVRQLAARFPTAAVCCDSGKSFRKALDPTYKAQRPQQEAPLRHQIQLATERLRADGFPVWCIDGFEADDVIATAVTRALAIDGTRVLIATADKDLLQLVGPRVSAKNVRDGALIDADAVKAKFGVTPAQMGDYLCLVGDASDNVIGAKGIGPKRAAELLALFGSLAEVYAAIERKEAKLSDGILNSLAEFKDRLPNVRALIAMRTDVEIPFEEIAADRTPKAAEESEMETIEIPQPTAERTSQGVTASVDAAKGRVIDPRGDATAADVASASTQTSNGHALAVIDSPAPPPAEWEKQLEPRSVREAQGLATAMYQARLFNGYGNAPAVLSTIMAGRELGLPAVASLRGFHIVEGRHCLAADLIRGLVLKSGLADFFKCTERTAERATFSTHRKDDPDKTPTTLTFTVAEGRIAFGILPNMNDKELAAKEASWLKSGWGRNPADMCVARAGAKLARLVYPEVVFGLYSPEEFD